MPCSDRKDAEDPPRGPPGEGQTQCSHRLGSALVHLHHQNMELFHSGRERMEERKVFLQPQKHYPSCQQEAWELCSDSMDWKTLQK